MSDDLMRRAMSGIVTYGLPVALFVLLTARMIWRIRRWTRPANKPPKRPAGVRAELRVPPPPAQVQPAEVQPADLQPAPEPILPVARIAELAAASGLSQALLEACWRNRLEDVKTLKRADLQSWMDNTLHDTQLRRLTEQRQALGDFTPADPALRDAALAALDQGDGEALDGCVARIAAQIDDGAGAPHDAVRIEIIGATLLELMFCEAPCVTRYLSLCARLGDRAVPETVEVWENARHVLSAAKTRVGAPAQAGMRHLVRDILVPALEELLKHRLPDDLRASRIAKMLTLEMGQGWDTDEAMGICRLALRVLDAEVKAHDTPEERNWPYSAIQRDRSWTLERMYDLSGDIAFLQAAYKALELWFAHVDKTGLDADKMGAFTVGRMETRLREARGGR